MHEFGQGECLGLQGHRVVIIAQRAAGGLYRRRLITQTLTVRQGSESIHCEGFRVNVGVLKLSDKGAAGSRRIARGGQHPYPILISRIGVGIPGILSHKEFAGGHLLGRISTRKMNSDRIPSPSGWEQITINISCAAAREAWHNIENALPALGWR
jgi:hypothetical protein